ncbi:MAG: HAD hydrolase family protein [Bacteroidota bacterium]|jgi:3-deoxy-D-manno-octulosonate 8-phosphate phosphatase (KDO 8-P phosphatase)
MTIPPVKEINPQVVRRLSRIKAFLLDVDGVLTDGSVTISENGIEDRVFTMMDADSIRSAQSLGIRIGLITTYASELVIARARELGIHDIYHGMFDKSEAYKDFKELYDLEDESIAFMGDGILDVSVLKSVGFAATPANAHVSAKMAAHYISRYRGGYGAVREVLTMLVRVQAGDDQA